MHAESTQYQGEPVTLNAAWQHRIGLYAPVRLWVKGLCEAQKFGGLAAPVSSGSAAGGPGLDPAHSVRAQFAFQPGRGAGPAGQQEPDAQAPGPAHGKPEHLGRGGIKPRQVVDGDEQRRAGDSERSTLKNPAATANRSGGAPVSSARNSAASRACRCGTGSPPTAPTSIPSSGSKSAAKESSASVPLGRAASTRTPRARARRSPRSHSAVLPIPGPPVNSSAANAFPPPRNSATAASSASRPTRVPPDAVATARPSSALRPRRG